MVSYNNELADNIFYISKQISSLECYSSFKDESTVTVFAENIIVNLAYINNMSHKYLVIVTCKKLLSDLEYLKEAEKANDSDGYNEELYICKESIKSLLSLMNSCSVYDYSYVRTIDPLKELKTMVSFDTTTPTINFLVETLLESLRIINDSTIEDPILQKLLFIEHSNNRFPDEYMFFVTKKVTSIMKKKATETKVKEK